jgi:hypothetical protein
MKQKNNIAQQYNLRNMQFKPLKFL